MTIRMLFLPVLIFVLLFTGGCVSRPETQPTPPVQPTAPGQGGTTINAPTVVNQPPGSGQLLGLQVTRDPNNPERGWVLLGNQPVPVRLEGGAWMFDTDLSRLQLTPPPPPTPQQQQQQPRPQPAPAPQGTIPPPTVYMSPTVAAERLLIDKIELYRVIIARMKLLAENAQIGTVDEFNIMITRLETLLKEMERLQATQPPQPQPQPQPQP